MDLIRLVIRQPVTVAVAVVLLLLSGLIAMRRIAVQLTPTVEDTIIAVSTFWEGASPQEVEQEIIDRQEDKLQGLSGLRKMTSSSAQGRGTVRLEFAVGTDKDAALREVSDKLREVPERPENSDEPVVEASDPDSRDYIAWIVLGTTDPAFDIRTLQDFAEDRLKPVIERAPGVSEVNVLGGREREVQVRFDPVRLAQRRITAAQLAAALRGTNRNISAGEVPDGRNNWRVRTTSQYERVEDVESTVVARENGVPVLVRDVAEVFETYKEPISFVRSKGRTVLAINVQREVGTNVIEVMHGVRGAVAEINRPGGVLDLEARRLGLNGEFTLTQVYDQTIYIDQAIGLVRDNLWLGSILTIASLLLFLRSPVSIGIIAVSLPVSVIGAFVAMAAMGRSINVVSLAGMAFAVGNVVDNSIVVLENTFRHLEMGKSPMRAAYDGAREVWLAVVASTLTNVVVFVPILLVQEEVGQLFRDIALAVCAAMLISLVASITVVPAAAARALRAKRERPVRRVGAVGRVVGAMTRPFHAAPGALGRFIHWSTGGWVVRLGVIVVMTVGSLVGTWLLLPPADYLPTGNRNLVFGLMLPPSGYSIEQQEALGLRVEAGVRPFWEAGEMSPGSPERSRAVAAFPSVPENPWLPPGMSRNVTPPPLENYFFVGFDGIMFHGAIASDDRRVPDVPPLLQHASRQEVLPGILSFASQMPIFQQGGLTGSAVTIDLRGDDLDEVTRAAEALYERLAVLHGYGAVQPSPSNFNLPGPELRVIPDRVRLAEVGMTPEELGLTVQSAGDGAIVGEYRMGGDVVDLKVIMREAVGRSSLAGIGDLPVATPSGHVVPLASLGEVRRVTSPPEIKRVNGQRAVSLDFTASSGVPLESATAEVDALIAELRASGEIPPGVAPSYTGSASKLKSVRAALLGDGTFAGLMVSTVFLALVVTYLVLCVLFQSWVYPLVIMFSVPPATLGGFIALSAVHHWSVADPYAPDQNLDVLTMLGVVLLIGTVVNNAILLVHQSLSFMRGRGESEDDVIEAMPPRKAIAESVRTRFRPIMMTSFTTLLGTIPLVISPGSGSELYRGMGAVVLGGMLVSTVFTLLLAPLVLSVVLDIREGVSRLARGRVGRGGTPGVPTMEPAARS